MSVDALPVQAFASLPNGGPRPALIVLGGSGGSASDNRCGRAVRFTRLCGTGTALLSLDRDLQAAGRRSRQHPYLDTAYRWLARQPGVDASRIALHGTSLGATYALLGAVRSSRSMRLSRACLRMSSSMAGALASPKARDLRFRGAANHCRSCQHGYETEWLGRRSMFAASMSAAVLPSPSVPSRLDSGGIRGSLIVIGANDDQMWPSGDDGAKPRRAST